METETVDPKRPEFRNVPLRMTADLDDLIERAKEKTGLSKQDVMRLSLNRGLDILVEQLTGKREFIARWHQSTPAAEREQQ